MKRFIFVIAIMFSVLLTGCWDYHGMDEINIVSGIAIDKNFQTDTYMLTIEIVDVISLEEKGGAKNIYVESEGKTVFEAVRNCKNKLYNKMYFGSMEALIISKEIAQKEGILEIVDGLMRDSEPRETLRVIISEEETAKDLIQAKNLDVSNVSYEISKIIQDAQTISGTSKQVMMYQAYNLLKAEGSQLVLPSFRLAKNNADLVVESNGLAIFKNDRLVQFMPPEEARYYLIMTNNQMGGPIVVETEDGNASFELTGSKQKLDFFEENDQLHFVLNIEVKLNVIEMPSKNYELYHAGVLTQEIEELLRKKIAEIIDKAQNVYQFDIFSFGNQVYKRAPSLWNKFCDNWDTYFSHAQFDVNVKASITNAGFIDER